MIEKIFRITPLGRADSKIKQFLEQELDDHRFENYNESLRKYRNFKISQAIIRLLLYASVITSIAATFNVNLSVINKVASYIGFTLLLLLYAATNYMTMLYREEYHVQRDILISTVVEQRVKSEIQEGDFKEN